MTVHKSVFVAVSVWNILAAPISGYASPADPCRDPEFASDVLACRNEVVLRGVPTENRISAVLNAMAPDASIACTTSQASAQPAAPELGDLRCFQVFDSGLIVSFNLLAGLNGDRLEVSQPVVPGQREAVILGNIRASGDVSTLDEVLADAFRPVDRGSRVTCAFCHRPVDHPPVVVDGVTTSVVAGIRLNETVRGTVPKNGQVPPRELSKRLQYLSDFHDCSASGSPNPETCRRISVLQKSDRMFKLDGPVE